MRKRAVLLFAAITLGSTVQASATTCTEAVGKCRLEGANKPDIDQKCQAAGGACMKTGIFVGPITGMGGRTCAGNSV